MNNIVLSATALAAVVLFAPLGRVTAQSLSEEAERPMARSRWVTVREQPDVEIALESDDTVLVGSIDFAPRGIAMRIDEEAVTADCQLTESKDSSSSHEIKRGDDDERGSSTSTTMDVTHTSFHASCKLPEGTTAKAVQARAITVQVTMPDGKTRPHELTAKQLKKFQKLGK